jgi:hypothetical protein
MTNFSPPSNAEIYPLNAELNPIRHLLALVGARHIVHVSRIRVKKVCSNRSTDLICLIGFYRGKGLFCTFAVMASIICYKSHQIHTIKSFGQNFRNLN